MSNLLHIVYISMLIVLFGSCYCYDNYDFVYPDQVPTTQRPDFSFEKDENGRCLPSTFPPNPQGYCCGFDSYTENWIVGGNTTSIEQYPWLALIEYYNFPQNKTKTSCMAFLISSWYLLTAAHCVSGRIRELNYNPTHVILGEYDKNNDGLDCVTEYDDGVYCNEGAQKFVIEDIVAHPGYSPQGKHDIALIRLKKFVPYTEFIRPICLTSLDINSELPQRVRLWIAGWGAVSQRKVNEQGKWLLANNYTNVKQHVRIPLVDLEECRSKFNYSVDEHQVCAGGEVGKDSCAGDSGTPLMWHDHGRYLAVGLLNYGTKQCGIPMPAVYINVFMYLDWIKKNIRE